MCLLLPLPTPEMPYIPYTETVRQDGRVFGRDHLGAYVIQLDGAPGMMYDPGVSTIFRQSGPQHVCRAPSPGHREHREV